MRVEKVMRNGMWGSAYQVLSIILGFIGRTVFIKYLSAEYLGISGLFTNVLTVLSMTELGFSSAVSYHLYGLIAKKDEKEIAGVIQSDCIVRLYTRDTGDSIFKVYCKGHIIFAQVYNFGVHTLFDEIGF